MAERPFPAEPTAKERAMMERMKREREQQKAQDRAYSEAMPVVDDQTQPYNCGGKVKKMAKGGNVRGGGIAQRGVGRGRFV